MDKCGTCNSIVEPESKRTCPITNHDICPNCWTFIENTGYVLSEKGLVTLATNKIKLPALKLEKMCLDELLSMLEQFEQNRNQALNVIDKHVDDMYNKYLDACAARNQAEDITGIERVKGKVA